MEDNNQEDSSSDISMDVEEDKPNPNFAGSTPHSQEIPRI